MESIVRWIRGLRYLGRARYCPACDSHSRRRVLEHIPDDARARSEIFRVLSPNGAAFIEVPVLCRQTYEDPTRTSAAERLLHFGQIDHVSWWCRK